MPTAPMRIAIVSTSKGMSPGYRHYLIGLVARLRDLPSVGALEIFTPRGSLMAADEEIDAHIVTGGTRGLRRAVRAFGAHVVLAPAARSFRCPPIPTVTMVWNMEPLQAPFAGNTLREATRNVGRRMAIKRSARRSQALHVPSDLVRRFLVERWNVPLEKISVVPLAAAPPLAERDARPPHDVPAGAPFIFTAAGSLRPTRGVADPIDALTVLASRGVRPTLVIAGAPTRGTTGFAATLTTRAARAGIAEQIVWVGHLEQAEMAWCFMNSDMFIATTRAEALSVLLLEALTYRCLTVATDVETSREVFGDTAIYYPPGDGDALADAICEMAETSAADRERRRGAAAQRAIAFNWTAVTAGMATMLEQARS